MNNPFIISLPVCKKNMCYSMSKFTKISETFSPLLEELRVQKSLHSQVIIYCRRFADCYSDLYKFFKHGLGVNFTDSIDAPDLSQFRLLDPKTNQRVYYFCDRDQTTCMSCLY